jgi:hypothetical protein
VSVQVASGKNSTLVTGGFADGAYVGTGCNPTADGLGLALGDPFGDVLGDVVATLLFDGPRLARTMAPTLPSSRITKMAMIAGTSHGGRSEG